MPDFREFTTALVDAVDDVALDKLADRLAPKLAARLAAREQPSDEWMRSSKAAAYLGISVNALHKLTAARAIPFEQEGPGCKMWFKRSELDAWRRGESVS
jgi:excisionase family DNA binding protein